MKNTNKGITLIALVITIIVMLILVAVTISMAVNGGLFEYAQRAGTKTNEATEAEQLLASGRVEIDGTVYNSIDEYVNAGNKGGFEEIFKTATKHPQQTESNDIGIAEDGSAVNLDLWLYTLIGNNKEYCLSGGSGSWTTPGYKNENITNTGTIQGKVPMYINEEGTNSFYPVTSMESTFLRCGNLIIAPEIPSTVKIMDNTFFGCTKLTTAPEIPAGVTSLSHTFEGTAITEAPVIPGSVTNMEWTFGECTKLTETPFIPNNVTIMGGTFYGTAIKTAPVIPNGVTSLVQTFQKCTNLTTAPAIPNNVTDMRLTFSGCTALKEAPVIPSGVTNMDETFMECSSLNGILKINTTLRKSF